MAERILFIIPEMIAGGAQRSLANVSNELARLHEVHVAIFNRNHTVAYPLTGTIHSLDVDAGNGLVGKIAAFFRRVKRLRILKRKLRVTVAVSFLEGADYINVMSRDKEKVILSVRGSKLHDENMRAYFFRLRRHVLIPYFYRRANQIVAVSDGIARELMDHYRVPAARVHVIGNYYDVNAITGLAEVGRPASIDQLYNRPILITAGRLAKEKGLNGLIEVFAAVRRKRNDLRLVFVGDGPERERIFAVAEASGLRYSADATTEPDIFFAGHQDNVFQYLRGATLFLMNSGSEGFPNGMVEAMMCKVPVVAADCPYGPKEILAPERVMSATCEEPYISTMGVLMPRVSASTVAMWVEMIETLVSQPALRKQLSDRAFERARSFNKENVVDSWQKVITL